MTANDNNCVVLTSSNFNEVVAKSDLPVIIKFEASWCGPCRMMNPIFLEVASELKGKYKFATVNIDDNQDIASIYRVSRIPYFVVVNKNEIEKTTSGAMSKSTLMEWILNA